MSGLVQNDCMAVKSARHRRLAAVAVILGTIALVACTTPINTLREDPQGFDGKTVMLAGTVDRVIPVPFSDYAVYTMSDDGGSVVVVTTETRERGQSIRLKGRIVAFPEKEAQSKTNTAVSAVADFLVEKAGASREGADKAAGAVMKVVSTIASGLGGLFFVVEL